MLLKILCCFVLLSVIAVNSSTETNTSVITAKPLTVRLRLSDEFRGRMQHELESGSLNVVRLRIKGIQIATRFSSLEAIRVFIDKPQANADTPTDDSHFAGTFVLSIKPRQDVIVNAASALKAARYAQEGSTVPNPLLITLVPVSRPPEQLPKDLAIPFDAVTVELP
jgi:hypothetical protein